MAATTAAWGVGAWGAAAWGSSEEAGPVVVTPAAASAVAGVGQPVVLLPSVTPTPAAAVAGVGDPTVVLGSVVVAPAPAEAIAGVEAPVVPDSIVYTPAPATAVARTAAPTVHTGLTPLRLQWDVDAVFRSLLLLDWEVQPDPGILGGTLPLVWSIDELLARLRLDWDVHQTALEAAYDEDQQRPWARVTTP